MRRRLDRVYLAAAWIAAFTILAIALLVSAQVLLNVSTRTLGLPLPSTIPSYADFSGFMLAAATFLAMPYTFRTGGHIRVSLVTSRLSAKLQQIAEICVLAVSALLLIYACFYIGALVHESWHFNDVSPGIIPIPLWIPQLTMAAGMGLLCIAVLDTLVQTITTGHPVIKNAEEV